MQAGARFFGRKNLKTPANKDVYVCHQRADAGGQSAACPPAMTAWALRGCRNFKRSFSRFVTVSVDARLVKLVPNNSFPTTTAIILWSRRSLPATFLLRQYRYPNTRCKNQPASSQPRAPRPVARPHHKTPRPAQNQFFADQSSLFVWSWCCRSGESARLIANLFAAQSPVVDFRWQVASNVSVV